MKSIRTFLFSVICAAFVMTAFSQCSPAVEDDESINGQQLYKDRMRL